MSTGSWGDSTRYVPHHCDKMNNWKQAWHSSAEEWINCDSIHTCFTHPFIHFSFNGFPWVLINVCKNHLGSVWKRQSSQLHPHHLSLGVGKGPRRGVCGSITCDASARGLGVSCHLITHPDVIIQAVLQIWMGRMWSLVTHHLADKESWKSRMGPGASFPLYRTQPVQV